MATLGSNDWRAGWRASLVVATLATLALGWPTLFYPFGRDQGIFAVVGHVWLDGGLPYRDALDIKPPFIYGTYSIAEGLFGYAQSSIRILDLLATASTAWILSRIAAKISSTAAIIAAIAYPFIYFLGFGFWDTAQAESFAQPFAAGAVLLTANRRSAFLIGLTLGVAAMYKPTFGLLLLPCLWYFKPSLRDILRLGAGLIVPAAATVLYFAARDGLDLLARQVELMRAYASPITGPGTKFSLGRVMLGTALMQIAVLIGAVSILSWRDRLVRLALGWWLVSMLMLIVQGRFFTYHALPIAAPAALLLAMAIGHLDRRDDVRRVASVAAMLAVAVFTMAQTPYFTRTQDFKGPYSFDASDDVAAAKVIAGLPGSTMWIDGFESNLYFNAHRLPPTRHLSTAPITGEQQIPMSVRAPLAVELEGALRANPPSVIVEVNSSPRPPFERYGRSYSYAGAGGRFQIYRLLPQSGGPETRGS